MAPGTEDGKPNAPQQTPVPGNVEMATHTSAAVTYIVQAPQQSPAVVAPPVYGSGGLATYPLQAPVSGMPVGAPAPVMEQNVYVEPSEPCCNIYWVLFAFGLFLLPPLLICGAFGLRSDRHYEKQAGIANAVVLGVYAILIVVALVA